MSKLIYYTVSIENEIDYDISKFSNQIKTILDDPRGFIMYKFIEIPQIPLEKRATINFILSKPITIKNICNFVGLSCSSSYDGNIYINFNKWKNGAKASGLTVKYYRYYLIYHEVFHQLYFMNGIYTDHHEKIPKSCGKAPILIQQTLGIGNCKPNYYPLKSEINKFLRRLKLQHRK